jgi:hypothetical protein
MNASDAEGEGARGAASAAATAAAGGRNDDGDEQRSRNLVSASSRRVCLAVLRGWMRPPYLSQAKQLLLRCTLGDDALPGNGTEPCASTDDVPTLITDVEWAGSGIIIARGLCVDLSAGQDPFGFRLRSLVAALLGNSVAPGSLRLFAGHGGPELKGAYAAFRTSSSRADPPWSGLLSLVAQWCLAEGVFMLLSLACHCAAIPHLEAPSGDDALSVLLKGNVPLVVTRRAGASCIVHTSTRARARDRLWFWSRYRLR